MFGNPNQDKWNMKKWLGKPTIEGLPPPEKYDAVKYHLENASAVFIKQQVEMLEVFAHIETPNRYWIMDENANNIMLADEKSGFLQRACGGESRGMMLEITDGYNRPVITVEKPFACCLGKCDVSYPPNRPVGHIDELVMCPCVPPEYDIKDPAGQQLMHIKGPGMMCRGCSDLDFEVTSSSDGRQIAQITRIWDNMMVQAFADADFFGIKFYPELPLWQKVAIVGAAFLIDLTLFEQGANDKGSNVYY